MFFNSTEYLKRALRFELREGPMFVGLVEEWVEEKIESEEMKTVIVDNSFRKFGYEEEQTIEGAGWGE